MKFELTKKEIEILCEAGSLAPSGGNLQSWKVKVVDNSIYLYLDLRHGESFLDVGNAASVISLGCFCENVCQAADKLKLKYKVEVANKISDGKPICVINFLGKRENDKENLYLQIPDRQTNRQLSDGRIIKSEEIKILQNLAREFSKSIELNFISNSKDIKKAVDSFSVADGIRLVHPLLRNQMMNEFRYSTKEVLKTRDGIDLETLELPQLMKKLFLLIKKTPKILDMMPRKALEGMTKPVLLSSSHLGCISMPSAQNIQTIFEIGRLVERIWLTATKLGISFQPWTTASFLILRSVNFPNTGLSDPQEKEMKVVKNDLAKIFGYSTSRIPIFIFRISYSKAPTARSLKIPWQKFTVIR